MDYKNLINDLLGECDHCTRCAKDAYAIETLMAERDAAVADLAIAGDCKTCGNMTPWCMDNPDACKGYKWRSPKSEGVGIA